MLPKCKHTVEEGTVVVTLSQTVTECTFCKVEQLEQRLSTLMDVLTEIDGIRNNIIGAQGVNWSRDIYPLVAALGRAGFEGAGYEHARARLVAQQNARATLDAARDRRENMLATNVALLRAHVKDMTPTNCCGKALMRAGGKVTLTCAEDCAWSKLDRLIANVTLDVKEPT